MKVKNLLRLGMYFFPVFMLRLLVEEVIKSFFSVSGEEEGTIMDWDITLPAGATEGVVGVLGDGIIPAIISPVMDWLMLGGRSPTPFMLELSPAIKSVNYFLQLFHYNLINFKKKVSVPPNYLCLDLMSEYNIS